MSAFFEEINALLMHLLQQRNVIGRHSLDTLDVIDRHDQDMCLRCRVDVVECRNLVVLFMGIDEVEVRGQSERKEAMVNKSDIQTFPYSLHTPDHFFFFFSRHNVFLTSHKNYRQSIPHTPFSE